MENENSGEINKVYDFENADVFCTDCTGQLVTLQVNTNTPRLFTVKYYQKLILQCNVCKKTTKVFTQKIKK